MQNDGKAITLSKRPFSKNLTIVSSGKRWKTQEKKIKNQSGIRRENMSKIVKKPGARIY